jgi:hypothetical protein
MKSMVDRRRGGAHLEVKVELAIPEGLAVLGALVVAILAGAMRKRLTARMVQKERLHHDGNHVAKLCHLRGHH